MNNIYSSYTSSPGGLLDSQKAATLPSMGMPSAYGGLPLSSEAFQRDYGRQNCYISTPCMPNFGTIMDGQKSNTCNGQTSSLFNADVRCTDFWLINNDLQANGVSLSRCTSRRTQLVSDVENLERQMNVCETQSSNIALPSGQCSNERVVSPRCACIVSTQSLVSGSASESQQQQQQHNQSVGVDSVDLYTNLVTTAAERCSPTCSSSSRASSAHAPRSTMVLSQHLPVAAKPTYYGGSANQKTFAGNYKNVQTVISKPPPARYHSSSAYNMMSYNNGQPCVDNSSVKPLRNIYPMEAKNGMRDVPMWLKSLRLHKYTQMFQQMGYDEMMALDERKLEALNVTKGARKKIMQSIQKLRERVPMLKQMEKSIEERGGDVGCVIVELRGTMNTPIRSFPPPGSLNEHYTQARIDGIGYNADELDDENLPGHITRILGKVHDTLIESHDRIVPPLEDEYYGWLLQTYDRITNHEAFTAAQKQRVASWKRAMRKVCSPQIGRKGTRLPHASVLLASGGANASNSQPAQCSPSSSVGTSRMTGGATGNTPCVAHVISQTALQNALASLLHACSSHVPLSAQAAAYYLGIASVTSLLSSPELVKQLQDLMAAGNAPSPQFQQQLHQQLLANAFAQGAAQQQQQQPPNAATNTAFMTQQKPVTGITAPVGFTPSAEQTFPSIPVQPQQQQSCPQVPQANAWKNFAQPEPQTPFCLADQTHALTTSCGAYSLSDKVVSAPISDSSIPPCLAASTSVMSQNGAPISATGVGVHSLYSPTVDLRPCCAHIVSSGANCISSTAANPLDGGVQQRLPPHTSPFPPSPPAHPINGHRRSSSNTSSIASGLCSTWNGVEQAQSSGTVTRPLFESVTLPLTHMNSMPSMQSAVQQQRRLSNQESSLFGAARPACASSVSPSSRLGSTSSSSGYSSSASDRSSGAGSPPGLMVYNFASEHASGELDNMCRDVAALSFKVDSQLLHMNMPSSGMNILP